jgi:hypothetical protein
MKTFFAFALALLCGVVNAQVTATSRWELRLLDSGVSLGRYTTQTACDTAARERARSATYECPRVLVVTAPQPTSCTAQPSVTTASIACPSGTTGSWVQTTTVTVAAAPACTVTTTLTPLAAPAGACVPIVTPPPGATVLYFSDCQAGAAAGCVAGHNANPGTAASPKQNLSGVNYNALPAGSQLLFARGGAWSGVNLSVRNLNATPTAPIVFDAYGTGPRPLLMTSTSNAVNFGTYSDTVQDGGYTFRGLKFDGGGTGVWGFFLMGATRNVILEDNEITGFEIAVHSQNMGEGNEALVIRNNDIHHNREMGMLGDANNMVIEGNTFRENNFSGSGFNHGLYLGGHATNGIVRNNRFTNNSQVNGVCLGGNLTVHGQWDGLLIEGNTIEVRSAAPGCWGISINDGYTSAEFFRNVTVRGNEVVNTELAIAVRAAPGIVIGNNKLRSNQTSLPSGIAVNAPNGADDDPGIAPILQNNVVCFTDTARTMSDAVRVQVAGASITGNVLRSGAEATTGACAP